MLKLFEKAFVVFALLYFSGGMLILLAPDNMPQSDDPPSKASVATLRKAKRDSGNDPSQKKNKVKVAVEVFIYGTTVLLIAFNLADFVSLFRKHPWLWLLILLTMLSTLWSDSPGFSARRSLVLLASTCFGVYLATRYTMREILRLIYIVGVIAVLACFVVVWRKPDIGIASGVTAGAWQGIFGQKNTLGRFMAFQVLAFGIGLMAEKGAWRWFCIFGAVLSLPLVVMSKDTTAYLALPMLLVLIPLFQYTRTHSLTRLTIFFTAIGATVMGLVFVLVADLKEILMMLGKNSSLSGRTDIWSMVWGKFLERPWLGYGYSAFWMGKDGAQSAGIWEALRWAVPHSHNGFLDILVQVGAVGLIMFFVGYILFFREALRCARASKTILGLFPLLYLTFMILFNCSEGSIIREENMFWVLYATTWALTTRWLALAQTVTRKPVAAVSPVRRPRPIAVPAWRFDATN